MKLTAIELLRHERGNFRI